MVCSFLTNPTNFKTKQDPLAAISEGRTIHSVPPTPLSRSSSLAPLTSRDCHNEALPTPDEVVPDSQPYGTLPSFYTSPIPVPTFTLISSESVPAIDSSPTASSNPPEPSEPLAEKVQGRISYKYVPSLQYIPTYATKLHTGSSYARTG